jgi:hypothetical protein
MTHRNNSRSYAPNNNAFAKYPMNNNTISHCPMNNNTMSHCPMNNNAFSNCPMNNFNALLNRPMNNDDEFLECLADSNNLFSTCQKNNDTFSNCPMTNNFNENNPRNVHSISNNPTSQIQRVQKSAFNHSTKNTPKPIVKQVPKPIVKQVVRQEQKPIVKQVVKQETKPIARPDVKTVSKHVAKPDIKTISKPVVKPDIKTVSKPVVKRIIPVPVDNTKKVNKSPPSKVIKKSIKENTAEEEIEQSDTILEKLCELSASNTSIVLKEFIDIVYENTHCVGGLHKGKLYKELPNTWSERKTFTNEEKKYECEGEEHDDCSVADDINKYVKGDVKIVWQFNNNKMDSNISLDIDKKKHSHLNKPNILGYMKTLSQRRKECFFEGDITICSNAYDSDDHRGSDHCMIMLPNDTDITLNNPTLDDLVEALYLGKTKKFNKWYELYTGCTVTNNKNGDITISTKFDNGS